MSFEIIPTPKFARQLKKLSKNEIKELLADIGFHT